LQDQRRGLNFIFETPEVFTMINRREALAAGLTLLPAANAWRTAQAASMPPLAEGRVRLPNGRRLGYAECGNPSGPLVLYFHGTPGARVEIALIAEEAAAAGVRLIAVERPGVGLSDFYVCRRVLDWPADVAAFVDALGYAGTSFGVIGMSGGAPYALACVKCMPKRLTHVAIVSGHTPLSAPVQPGNQDKLITFVTRRPRLARIGFNVEIRTLNRNPDKLARRVMDSWSEADRQLVSCNGAYYATLIRTLQETTRCGSDGLLQAVSLLGSDWGFRLCDLSGAPISIWQGGCDPIAPPSMGHYFQQQIAGSELTIDPKAGHLTMPKWHAAEILSRFTAEVVPALSAASTRLGRG
jgi:pimeloyl-ACP methyl ester carboxylesterase